MTARNLLRVTALLEGGMASAFLFVPSLPSELLFGQKPQTSLALILGHFVGAVLLSLSVVCWLAGNAPESSLAYGVVKTMLFYDAVAALILLSVRMSLGLSAILLWPAVVIHLALGAWCIVVLLISNPVGAQRQSDPP